MAKSKVKITRTIKKGESPIKGLPSRAEWKKSARGKAAAARNAKIRAHIPVEIRKRLDKKPSKAQIAKQSARAKAHVELIRDARIERNLAFPPYY